MSKNVCIIFLLPCHCSFIAKTETTSADMEYISKAILNGNITKNRNKSNRIRTLKFEAKKDPERGELLAFFSRHPDAKTVIQKLTERYNLDMKLFGYDTSYIDGNYYAVCTYQGQISPCS